MKFEHSLAIDPVVV